MMIQLANVSQTVGCPLATAKALVAWQPHTLGCMANRYCGGIFSLPTHHGTNLLYMYALANKVEILRIEFQIRSRVGCLWYHTQNNSSSLEDLKMFYE